MSYDLQDLFPDQDYNADAAKHLQLDFDFSEFLNQDTTFLEHSHVFASADLSVNGGGDFDFTAFDALEGSSDLTRTVLDNTTTQHGYDNETVSAPVAGPSVISNAWESLHASQHDTTTPASADSMNGFLNGTMTSSNPRSTITPPPSTQSSSQRTSPLLGTLPEPSPAISLDGNEPDTKKRKRERNTEAARRYRQRRQDRLEELGEALAAMTKDRDGLRLKLARAEAEADILRGLMAKKG